MCILQSRATLTSATEYQNEGLGSYVTGENMHSMVTAGRCGGLLPAQLSGTSSLGAYISGLAES